MSTPKIVFWRGAPLGSNCASCANLKGDCRANGVNVKLGSLPAISGAKRLNSWARDGSLVSGFQLDSDLTFVCAWPTARAPRTASETARAVVALGMNIAVLRL